VATVSKHALTIVRSEHFDYLTIIQFLTFFACHQVISILYMLLYH